MTKQTLTVTRPYLVRAIYEWILDNHCTPYIVVNANYEACEVPLQYVEEGKIVLNVAPTAVQQLLVANDHVEFNARFGGVAHRVYVPIMAVMAIYARENGRGMVFHEDEDGSIPPTTDTVTEGSKSVTKKPHLTIVK